MKSSSGLLRMLHSEEEWLGGHKTEITEKSSGPSRSLTAVNFSRPRNRRPTWKNARRHGFVSGTDLARYDVSAEAQNEPLRNLAPYCR
jgi:hypothetical protein